MKDDENPEDGECDLCEARVGNAYLVTVGDVCEACVEARDERDSLRAELAEVKERLIKEQCEHADSIDIAMGFKARAERAEAALREIMDCESPRDMYDLAGAALAGAPEGEKPAPTRSSCKTCRGEEWIPARCSWANEDQNDAMGRACPDCQEVPRG